MLNKNIYILFSPGYSGTYIHWAISRSEIDLSKNTVDDPINKKIDKNFGGVGTAHLHTRIPTHQNLQQHLCWMIRNQPKEKKIYILNAHQNQPIERTIDAIMWYDPDPVFIYIHDGNNMDNRKYGLLNLITKWPIFFKANQIIQEKYDFDVENLDSLKVRNTFFEHFDLLFPYVTLLNHDVLQNKIYWNFDWYRIRNEHNPHEVNESMYLLPKLNLPIIFDICLKDIVSDKFPDWLDQVVSVPGLGEFNTEYVRSNHNNYCASQLNFKWFDEIKKFRETLELTDYFKSNRLLEAFIMLELKDYFINSVNWRDMSIEDILSVSKQHPNFKLIGA